MLNIETLVKLIGGVLPQSVDPAESISGYCIHSSEAKPGDVFFALPGQRVHGIEFAPHAIRQGASLVVTDTAIQQDSSGRIVHVKDAVSALAQIACAYRQQTDAMVIGVTGTVGKTTTRRTIAAVMAAAFRGVQSPHSFNNQIGVPLSLLQLALNDDYAVIEVGASCPGEIASLSSLVQPEMAVITQISPVHLQGMKSLQMIQNEKAELIRALPATGTAFLNADDHRVAELRDQTAAQVVTFGVDVSADVRATNVECNGRCLCLVVDGFQYEVPLVGRHHLASVLAGIAVGIQVGLDSRTIQAGLQTIEPAEGRCRIVQQAPFLVIDDTYNSSPASVDAAANVLNDLRHGGRRFLVLNDMLDLGGHSAVLHHGVGARLADSDLDHVLVTGTFAADVVEGYLQSGGALNRISSFTSTSQLTEVLKCMAFENDAVLVKGSRATRMEQVVEVLTQAKPTEIRRAA